MQTEFKKGAYNYIAIDEENKLTTYDEKNKLGITLVFSGEQQNEDNFKNFVSTMLDFAG